MIDRFLVVDLVPKDAKPIYSIDVPKFWVAGIDNIETGELDVTGSFTMPTFQLSQELEMEKLVEMILHDAKTFGNVKTMQDLELAAYPGEETYYLALIVSPSEEKFSELFLRDIQNKTLKILAEFVHSRKGLVIPHFVSDKVSEITFLYLPAPESLGLLSKVAEKSGMILMQKSSIVVELVSQ